MSITNLKLIALISGAKSIIARKQVTHGDPCWAPPLFPKQGRLPLSRKTLEANIGKIEDKELDHRQNFPQKNRNPCCKTVHVSLFFDGTNNNENNDTAAKHPSNVAKLYHASAPNDDEAINNGFFAYYLPGVGTPFPEVHTNEYYSNGLTFATGGEARVSWALMNVCNALHYEVTKTEITIAERRRVLDNISTRTAEGTYTNGTYDTSLPSFNHYNPIYGIFELLKPIKDKLLTHTPKLVALKLYVYGFSRGSAEARTFVYWLDRLLGNAHHSAKQIDPQHVRGYLYGIPVSVEFLGLYDTVAAVGIANVVPMMTGHNGWAGGTQQLPKSDLVKCCYHMTAAHEQRQSFCLDSVRTPEGNYPPNTYEIIYPGMHSDVGGAYPVGDQGKSRGSASDILSQIALHDMYAAAIDAGAPLAISPEIFALLPQQRQESYLFRKMTNASYIEFEFSANLVDKFNSWLAHTLPETIDTPPRQAEQCFLPPRFATASLESVIEDQLILITAWRIGRYASEPHSAINLTQQAFFQQAPQHAKITAQPFEPDFGHQAVDALTEEYHDTQQKIQKRADKRKKEKEIQSDLKNWVATNVGTPTFDATNARGQLWEASLEFAADYAGKQRPDPLIDISRRRTQADCIRDVQTYIGAAANCELLPKHSFPISVSSQSYLLQLLDGKVEEFAFILTNQFEHEEYEQLKIASQKLFADIISPQLYGVIQQPELTKIISLFDDYIHDSRAWFMHSESGVREPFSSYFLSRMIYFGDHWNKSLKIITQEQTTGIPVTLTSALAFYYIPTYGIRLYNQKTNQEVPFDDSRFPPASNKIIVFIREIIKKRQEQAYRNTAEQMRIIAVAK
ncbi:DUF2235 domain-containing protein [Providencia rettgeri]|nr:DUF2235 domain-containing protein [Providencia rettgeri]